MKGAGNLQLTVSCRPHCRTHTMKLKKNLAAAALAVAMVASLATPVFAIEGTSTNSPTGKTELEYNVTEGFTWTIPSKVTFSEAQGSTGAVTASGSELVGDASEKTVTVTKNVIAEGKTLKISVKGEGTGGAFVIKNGTAGTTVLTYTVGKADPVESGEPASYEDVAAEGEILTVSAGTLTGAKVLQFKLNTKANGSDNSAIVAGKYTGNAIFTATVE